MHIKIEVDHKINRIQEVRILSKEEIENCVLGVGFVLKETLSKMSDNIIKQVLALEYNSHEENPRKESS